MSRKISCLLALVAIPALAFSQIVETTRNGKVDWEKRVILATGFGAPNKSFDPSRWRISAIRAAELDAMAKLLAITEGITINSTTTVKDFTIAQQEITGRVQGVLRNFKTVATRSQPDGTVEVDVVIPIDGDLSNVIIPVELGKKPPLEPQQAQKVQESQTVQEPGQLYTGMIVNAKGLGVRPAMLPKIVNEEGKEVYGTGYVSRDYAVAQGIVGYSKDLEKASADTRVTATPLVVKGIASLGPTKTDVVISNEDASKIHALGSNLQLMQQCRVIILVD